MARVLCVCFLSSCLQSMLPPKLAPLKDYFLMEQADRLARNWTQLPVLLFIDSSTDVALCRVAMHRICCLAQSHGGTM